MSAPELMMQRAIEDIGALLDDPKFGNGDSSLIFALENKEHEVVWSVCLAREHHALPLYEAAQKRQHEIRWARLIPEAWEVE